MSAPPRIRPAKREDAALMFSLIVELAEYERAADHVVGTEAMLEAALFGPKPVAEALIADLDGEPAGFALFYTSFSTWQCVPGIWLEDLVVRERFRSAGVGGALLRELAALALQRGCGRLEWAVLDWNAPATGFYDRLGASSVDEWRLRRLDGEALERAARVERQAQ
ncbi:MAG: N-acetyltransferase family protein [Solirubrobacteraceae bacterium]